MSPVDELWKEIGITEELWKNRLKAELRSVLNEFCKGSVFFIDTTENPREPHRVVAVHTNALGRNYECLSVVNHKVTVLHESAIVGYIPEKATAVTKPQASKLAHLPNALRILTEVMDYGDKTHPPLSWKENDPAVHLDKFYRHALIYGETDPESGMPSLWHALCNLAMYIELKERAGGKT